MAQIELTQVEIALLREILQRYLAELIMEIAHSDRKDFREFLNRRREFMEDFIRRLDRELASGKGEMISMDRLKEVEILQGLTEWELQSIARFFQEENIAAGRVLYAKRAPGPISSIFSSKGAFRLLPRRWAS